MQIALRSHAVRLIALIISLTMADLSMGKKHKQQQFLVGDSRTIEIMKFKGKIKEDEALSAVGFVGKYLLLGADEGRKIQVLEPNSTQSVYRRVRSIDLPIAKSGASEVDIEGIAVEENTVYVVGSHTAIKKTKGKTKKNNRENVYRFKLDPGSGKLESKIKRDSLKKILKQDPILQEYLKIPNDKNGIDIEGIAVKNQYLYFGFRTPILKDIYSPVIVAKFKDLDRKDKYELHHVNLGGNGIRDMVATNDGFLILADATAEDASHYQVYFWDGRDEWNIELDPPATRLLTQIPAAKKTRAEGITILQETEASYSVLVIYDGVAKGNPSVFEISK